LKLAALGLGVSFPLTLAASEALGNVLGGATGPALVMIGALVFYAVVSTPRRLLDAQRVAQARESVLLSAAATACLNAAGSGPRTILVLRSRDEAISKALRRAGRGVLLGTRPLEALDESSKQVASYSAAAALREVASPGRKEYDAGDEEARGLASSSELSRETKLPVFMTACFFAPIMLLLFAVFSHSYGTGSLVELAALEFIILDLAFYLTSGDRVPR
jgi:hypothetical protein